MALVANLCAALFLATLVYVSLRDVIALKISNTSVGVALLFALGWYGATGTFEWAALWMAALFFAIGFGLWIAGVYGGGDAKFMAVVGLMAGSSQVALTLTAMALACIAMLLAFAAVRTLSLAQVSLPHFALKYAAERKLPFGVPLSVAAAAALLARMGVIA
ncbi:MAG: prepilin peptidase [Pseudomonadota bacterium]